jgi:hypothetical protein
VPYEERRAVASDLKRIYTAVDQDTAADELTVAEKWDQRFPTISRAWREHWEHVTPFPAFPPDLRRIVYTTNTIEALDRQIRKTINLRGHCPTEDAKTFSERLVGQEREELADVLFAGDAVGEGRRRVDRVVVAAPRFLARDVAGCGELGDDAVRRALGDRDAITDVSQADSGVVGDADQYLRVPG